MRDRYSDETINKLARAALRFERQNRFKEALDIYHDLASEKNEFAIERIPLVKYREEQFKLRKVNLFIGLTSVLTIITAVLTITFSTLNHIVVTDAIAKEFDSTYLTNSLKSKTSSNDVKFNQVNINYHTIEDIDKNHLDSDFEIFVPKNITSSKLKSRIIEAVETYSSEIQINEENPAILLKTFNTNDTIGYVKLNTLEQKECDVYLL